MARVKSLKDLGKGSWKIASITPIKKPVVKARAKSSNPQLILWEAVKDRWPSAQAEYPAGVPDRKFRLDVAFVDAGLCLEFDGWQWHAKHLEDFKKDRRRQNLLVTHGWRVLRFTAADVFQDLDGCLKMIEVALSQ